ncbi:hypothetical protein TMS3_0100285 [Pseudomonas taeanensis MS-3]|jgi:Ni/Co efflux regulator RcnB|uniref:CigR n=1 Tax=Pseudomonas taeanensis MS-3 TaxID=1395571 RepID=A0A0A1YKL3_9PSED|nr:anti-virulence regulator CigR family protein [Pseudomonas taeanensis]KFX70415.1 hypothetical protein TMS3_0100285 [Pseudomonas taeanensis MS-3]
MKAIPLVTRLSIALLLVSPLLQAAPQENPTHRQEQHGQSGPSKQGGGLPRAITPSAGAGKIPKPTQDHARQPVTVRGNQSPPKNFAPVHRAFHERRAQIGQGPAVPPGLHIKAGKPLPKGYGKRLDAHALRGLPSYQGYEWRRVGRDVVLVAVATGVVFTILQGVLNN